MSKEVILKSVRTIFEIEFDSQFQAQIVFNSVNPEIITSPAQRSKLEMFLDESKIIIKIYANDSTSFRASLNSSIKWIILSYEIFNLNDAFSL